MVEHGRARIDDNPYLPSANRREGLEKIVGVELIDEEFQTTNENKDRSVVASSIKKPHDNICAVDLYNLVL
jgi:hypothetical protein